MKQREAIKIASDLLVIIFLIKGALSDVGIGRRFDVEQIYSFAYMGFAMAAYLFFNRVLSEPEESGATETPQQVI